MLAWEKKIPCPFLTLGTGPAHARECQVLRGKLSISLEGGRTTRSRKGLLTAEKELALGFWRENKRAERDLKELE